MSSLAAGGHRRSGIRIGGHHQVGSGDGPCGFDQETMEDIAVTPAEIIYQRRVAALAHAKKTRNVAETCRVFGISRKTYYEWRKLADHYGLEALMPKDRRRPALPNETPYHVAPELLSLAVIEPTLGARQYADRLCDRGLQISRSTVQRHLHKAGLGHKQQQIAKAAAIAQMTSGLVTEAAREEGPFGFCLFATEPGELVCVDSFYIGQLKGVGKVYQLTAIDVFTRWAVVMIVPGPVNASHTIRFVDHVLRSYRRLRAGDLERQRPRVRRLRLPGPPRHQGSRARAHPAALAEPQRRLRALPRHDPRGVLATCLPPPALQLDPTAPARGRLVPRHLPPPQAEPR